MTSPVDSPGHAVKRRSFRNFIASVRFAIEGFAAAHPDRIGPP